MVKSYQRIRRGVGTSSASSVPLVTKQRTRLFGSDTHRLVPSYLGSFKPRSLAYEKIFHMMMLIVPAHQPADSLSLASCVIANVNSNGRGIFDGGLARCSRI